MNEILTFRFFIQPQTHIRTTQAEKWMFAVQDDEYLKSFGMKKYLERIAKGSKNPGTPLNYYNRKKRIQKYWDYKRALKILADEQDFVMPTFGSWVKFFLPMPRSWGKKKRDEKCFTLMGSKPDVDNMMKGFLDSLMLEDESICDFRVSKFYYSGTGHIEITIGELPPAKGYASFQREDKIK